MGAEKCLESQGAIRVLYCVRSVLHTPDYLKLKDSNIKVPLLSILTNVIFRKKRNTECFAIEDMMI